MANALTPREQEKQERKVLSSYKMDGHRAWYLCLRWCRMRGETELESRKHQGFVVVARHRQAGQTDATRDTKQTCLSSATHTVTGQYFSSSTPHEGEETLMVEG